MAAETITAISRLWPLALILFLLVCVVLFRAQVRSLLDRTQTLRVKRGSMEAALSVTSVEQAQRRPVVSQEATAPLEEGPPPEGEIEISVIEPANAREWAEKMVAACRDGDLDAAQAAFAETQKAEDDPVKKLQYEALYASCRYGEGDTSALAQLRQLAEKEGVAAIAYPLLGQCYENFGEFKNAAEAYELAAQYASSDEERAQMVVRGATCLFKDGRRQDAYTTVMKQISDSTVVEALSALYGGLASLYELAKNPGLAALALEKALEIKPNDTRLRFRAGYSYGQKDLDHLALLHYKTLVHFDPDDAGSLNNLGVAYSRLDMSIRAVESFEAAASGNETLAAANLAEAYIAGGFKRRAIELIDQARKQEKVHARVGVAMEEISEREETEANAEQMVLEAARQQQRFLLSFASAYFTGLVTGPTLAGTWTFPDGTETTVTQTEERIEANWHRDDWVYSLTGHVRNRGAKISIHKMKDSLFDPPGPGVDETGYAYLSSDDRELFMMTMKGQEHLFARLTRSSDGSC